MPPFPRTVTHPDRETLSLSEVAIKLGTSTRHIRELARDGRLPFQVLGLGSAKWSAERQSTDFSMERPTQVPPPSQGSD